jgi:hypothetical protein
MKTCSTCAETKALSEFGKNSCKRDGLCAACKSCRNARRKTAYYKNPEKQVAAATTWNRANRARCREASKARHAKNPEKSRKAARERYARSPGPIKAEQKRYRSQNPGRCKAIKAKRRASKLKATPKWLTAEHRLEISLIYSAASLMTADLGEPYHVDHYVPLRGETVCGLHVPWNLQVLTGTENIRKKNRLPLELQDWVFNKD